MTFIACRSGCGVCCIIPSISSPIPGMPNGKPAGKRCIHLNKDLQCDIFFSPSRPKVCAGFKAEDIVCGNTPDDAELNLRWLEGLSV